MTLQQRKLNPNPLRPMADWEFIESRIDATGCRLCSGKGAVAKQGGDGGANEQVGTLLGLLPCMRKGETWPGSHRMQTENHNRIIKSFYRIVRK